MNTGNELDVLTEIYDLLYSLGATANYTGFFHTSYAVYLTIQQPERLLLITKWLYPEVAKHYNTSWRTVEKNIRTLAGVVWRHCPKLLSSIAKCSLDSRPTNSRFIAILAHYLRTQADEFAVESLPHIS